jgi:hypothetical protein
MSGAEWTNLNAFAARLHNVIDRLPYLDLKALFALLDALEESIATIALYNLVPSAACWILYAGFKLKTNNIGYPESGYDDGSKRVPWNVEDLYNGPRGFNEKRWLFWKETFGILKD